MAQMTIPHTRAPTLAEVTCCYHAPNLAEPNILKAPVKKQPRSVTERAPSQLHFKRFKWPRQECTFIARLRASARKGIRKTREAGNVGATS